MHLFPVTAKVRVLFNHFFHWIIEVFQLIRAGNISSPIHSSTAMNENNLLFSFFVNLFMKLSNKFINIIDINKGTQEIKRIYDQIWETLRIQQRPKYQFCAISSLVWIFFKELFFNISIFSLFCSQKVQEAHYIQLKVLKSSYSCQIFLQFSNLEMLMSTDRQISSHQIILQFLVFVNDAETVWIQLTVNYDHE